MASLPQIPVFSSGYIHASAVKSLALLGIGTDNVHKLTRDAAGRLDLDALERSLAGLSGAPAIVVANAGEVNAGDFDPIDAMADLADQYGRVAPRRRRLRALRPYLAEDLPTSRLARSEHGPHPRTATSGSMFHTTAGLRSSGMRSASPRPSLRRRPTCRLRTTSGPTGASWGRRARGGRAPSAIWATLRAYGRSGYRVMVERHLELARRLAERIDEEPELERLAEVPLNIVCFRWRPAGAGDPELDELNRRLGEALLRDGRVFAGTTVFEGKVAFRPAIVNWRTRPEDVDALVDVLLELAGQLRD